jgi:hypothetical protein
LKSLNFNSAWWKVQPAFRGGRFQETPRCQVLFTCAGMTGRVWELPWHSTCLWMTVWMQTSLWDCFSFSRMDSRQVFTVYSTLLLVIWSAFFVAAGAQWTSSSLGASSCLRLQNSI